MTLVAGLASALKDAADANGSTFELSMLGRADFEHLEIEAMKIDSLAEYLATLRNALLPGVASA